jgi:hypothetical protein
LPNINLKFTTTKEIENIIKSLKPKNSHGYDEISTNLLKASSVYIRELMSFLITLPQISLSVISRDT